MPDTASDACNCSALRQAARHVTRLYDEALASVGIGVNQYAVLGRLERLGPKTMQDLAALLVMDRTTLSRLLRPLEARALLSIACGTRDRRQKIVSLSAEGSALVAAARPLWAEAQCRYETSVGAAAAATLRQSLAEVSATRFEGPIR